MPSTIKKGPQAPVNPGTQAEKRLVEAVSTDQRKVRVVVASGGQKKVRTTTRTASRS